ncbi:DUF1566 domain-containing protein [bacterium]|nr:DUF1566 domain-containing protein [bacterium]
MKKFFVLAAISAAMFLMVSCGDSSTNDDKTGSGETANDEDSIDTESNDAKEDEGDSNDDSSSDQGKKQGELYGECYPNKTCNEGLVCEIEDNVCIREQGNSEDDSDIEPSDDATVPDDSDSGDSEAENDEDSAESEEPEVVLPECSATSETPCRNLNLIWSAKAGSKMNWEAAKSYCENDVNEGGFTDWRLPKIDELRTLIQNCEGTVTGGMCAISDPDHLSTEDLTDTDCICEGKENGYYSKLGDDEWCWTSSSVNSEERAWYVLFNIGAIATDNKSNQHNLRCVRNAD